MRVREHCTALKHPGESARVFLVEAIEVIVSELVDDDAQHQFRFLEFGMRGLRQRCGNEGSENQRKNKISVFHCA